jgi:opacity protein-like surface antigen
MRCGKFLAAFGLLVAMCLPAHAQKTAPKFELAGTYAYLRLNVKGPNWSEGLQTNGGTGSLTYNLTNAVGIVGEIGGYKTSTISSAGGQDFTFVSYLFGPRYSFRKWDTLTPYIQTLFGGVKGNNELYLGGNTSNPLIRTNTNAFAWTVGGGLDASVTRHLAVRVFQAEYFMTDWKNFGVGHQNSFRIETGLVWRFGKR